MCILQLVSYLFELNVWVMVSDERLGFCKASFQFKYFNLKNVVVQIKIF